VVNDAPKPDKRIVQMTQFIVKSKPIELAGHKFVPVFLQQSRTLAVIIITVTAAEQIIRFFAMLPLPGEGGYYVETYRALEKISEAALPARYTGERNFSTAILYLLTPDTFSALHRVKSDEIFHFYLGDPITMLQLHADGSSEVITLGRDILNGQRVQVTVPKDSWQGSFLNQGGDFALMGTTIAPGFEFADFEPASKEELLEQHPNQRELILRLTRRE
jgi:predicted cupin superfamily sugar epimerase